MRRRGWQAGGHGPRATSVRHRHLERTAALRRGRQGGRGSRRGGGARLRHHLAAGRGRRALRRR
ncbi:hypothetical protein B7486_70065, partial [cyanobacterium TDX16]